MDVVTVLREISRGFSTLAESINKLSEISIAELAAKAEEKGKADNSDRFEHHSKSVNEDRLLNIDEVAEFLNIKKSTVYAMTMHGTIPVVKFGKLNRFKKTDLLDFIEKHQRKNKGQMNKDLEAIYNKDKSKKYRENVPDKYILSLLRKEGVDCNNMNAEDLKNIVELKRVKVLLSRQVKKKEINK